MKQLQKIKIDDIENMIRLGDDVLRQMEFNSEFYDENGVSFVEKAEAEGVKANSILRQIREESHYKNALETQRIMFEVIREEKTFQDVYYDSLDDILEAIEPLKKQILGIFRNGAEQNTVTNETNFCADESVSDEYLLKLFAMRIRERRITIAVQRMPEVYFLLLRGHPCCHDGDEFIGIYKNIRKLKNAYETEKQKMKDNPEEYPSYLELQIYEFDEEEYENGGCPGKLVTRKQIWWGEEKE